ncbi:MAG TPA: hypothetical protein VFI31_00190 [Pirellulales bacterium]|nr:hypothetical protein [Pirellulales bacterium]
MKTLLWLMMLTAAAAGLTSDVARQPSEGGRALVQWLLFGGVLGGFIGLFVREPTAFLLFGIGAALTFVLLLMIAAMAFG